MIVPGAAMTDAFLCNGCGEFYHQAYRFVGIEMNLDAVVRDPDLTLDDVPAEAWELCDDDLGEDDHTGDLCVGCGRAALSELVSLFGVEDDAD